MNPEDLFWNFAYERQLVFERRRKGYSPPWTRDPILAGNRFTNPYRASDRVSQYLIKDVQYAPDASDEPAEVAFRTILFRIFNKIETYEYLKKELGEHPRLYENWDPGVYDVLLQERIQQGGKIWSGAYMMSGATGEPKHRTFLHLLDEMYDDETLSSVSEMKSYREVYELLLRFRVGPFLAMQFATDLNYSTAVNFDENDWVVPGVGALRGARKLDKFTEPVELICEFTASQEGEFSKRGLHFPWLGGLRRLHLMDVQNLFCEFDKYTRVAAPELAGGDHRAKIKARFDAEEAVHRDPIDYFYPPKWGLAAEMR